MSQTDDVERGPNGIPFVSMDQTLVGQWESGEFRVRLARTDGDSVNANLRSDDT